MHTPMELALSILIWTVDAAWLTMRTVTLAGLACGLNRSLALWRCLWKSACRRELYRVCQDANTYRRLCLGRMSSQHE